MSLDETSISRTDEGAARTRLVEALDLERLRQQDLFSSLVESAASIAQTPVSVVALVDETHTHTVSTLGAPARSRPCDEVLGCEVVERGHPLIIEDLAVDARFPERAPQLDGRPVRFYFGQPLLLDRSIPVGTLSVIDFEPRRLSANQRGMLTGIARQIELQLEYIIRQDGAVEQSGLAAEIAASQRVAVRRQALANYLLHDVINAATAVKADADFVQSRARQDTELSDALDDVAEAVDAMAERLHSARELLLDPDAMLVGYGRDVDLCRLLEELRELNESQLAKSGRTLTIVDRLERSFISGESKLISEMFEGLLGASLAAAPAHSDIEVRLEELDEQTVQITYRDQGRPMSDKLRRRLFGHSDELFDEGDSSGDFDASMARDTVEALSLCSMIVEAHGGVMHAEDTDGDGRCFRIHLPR